MDTEEKLSLIKQVGEEIITEEDLKMLLEEKKHPIAYDGFEPSGHLHLAQA
jgi:tyrosyl-tRNA synthetase